MSTGMYEGVAMWVCGCVRGVAMSVGVGEGVAMWVCGCVWECGDGYACECR